MRRGGARRGAAVAAAGDSLDPGAMGRARAWDRGVAIAVVIYTAAYAIWTAAAASRGVDTGTRPIVAPVRPLTAM